MPGLSTVDFRKRLAEKEPIIIAEGYLFEFIRRGRLRAGSLVPDVVLDSPELVKALHQEFVDAGTDVVQAFTYYTHRAKMRSIGREHELETINRKALEIAKEVAKEHDLLFAGGLCNSNVWDPEDPASVEATKSMFKEQAQWAKDAGVDYMIAETFWDYGEASLALSVLKEYGFPCEITICAVSSEPAVTFDGIPIPEALRRLEEEGADVVGLNCGRGPKTLIPLIKEVRAVCKGPISCKPVCYNTTEEKPNFQRLTYPGTDRSCYPHDLEVHLVSQEDIAWFGKQCLEIGVNVIGLCCGNFPLYMTSLATSIGRETSLTKYKSDRENNVMLTATKGEKPNRYSKLGAFSGMRSS